MSLRKTTSMRRLYGGTLTVGHWEMGEYSDLYLLVHVLMLTNVFENFRDKCMGTYGLDPCFYYTSPELSFDAMMLKTGVKLDLLADYDMLLMFENCIRGGVRPACGTRM